VEQEHDFTDNAAPNDVEETGSSRFASGVNISVDKAKKELNQAMVKLRSEIDRIDVQKAKAEAKEWVGENPTLSIFLSIGAGILVGKLISNAFSSQEAEDISLDDGTSSGHARDIAALIGATLVRHAHDATRKAKATGEQVLQKASQVGSQLSEQASEWRDMLSERSESVAEEVGEATRKSAQKIETMAQELGKTLADRSKEVRTELTRHRHSGFGFSDTVLDGFRAILATFAFKRVLDWVKRFT